jgi:hypothetical protein
MRGVCAEPRKQEDSNGAARRISEPLPTIPCLGPSLRGFQLAVVFDTESELG